MQKAADVPVIAQSQHSDLSRAKGRQLLGQVDGVRMGGEWEAPQCSRLAGWLLKFVGLGRQRAAQESYASLPTKITVGLERTHRKKDALELFSVLQDSVHNTGHESFLLRLSCLFPKSLLPNASENKGPSREDCPLHKMKSQNALLKPHRPCLQTENKIDHIRVHAC